jgi:tRNA threonylcarbamoyladenosine biosynthesis protein TsaE
MGYMKSSVFNKHVVNGLEETRNLSLLLSKQLKGGDIILFFGNLGAGKTTFIQFLAKNLGVTSQINSPTFNILKLYKVKNNSNIKTICHIDAYRLSSGKDLLDLGISEIIADKNNILIVEWAEKVLDVFSKKYIRVKIKVASENKRLFEIKVV